MLTLNDAREAAARRFAAEWQGPGTLVVGSVGYEDNDAYAFTQSASEAGPEFVLWDAPVAFVDKQSGAVSLESPLVDVVRYRLAAMTPVRDA